MKKVLLFCLFPVSLNIHAQLGIKTNLIPNCKPIMGDYLYMAETEVSNAQYLEFLKSIKINNGLNAFWLNSPDTTVWRSSLGYNEPFFEYYFRHIAYKDYPVVGVTQRQSISYCNWLRQKLLLEFKTKKIPIQDILIRLPTQKEWEMAARGGLDKSAIYPWPGDDYRKRHQRKRDEGKIRLDMLRNKSESSGGTLNDAGFITVPVYAYWPNGFGLYNMCGNVAEWLSEPGKSKGGSWTDDPYHCRIDVAGKYDGDTTARSTIGFRYVIEIVELESKSIVLKKLNAKIIEKEFTKTDSAMYAGITEVSNLWYQTFIQNSGLNKYAPNDTFWFQKDKYKYHLMYSKNAIFKDFPVVNITHEAAIKYCEWLTEYYNKLPDRKYKKVQFQLPNEDDWEHAARGGRIGTKYPWGGPYIQNSRGCYLANHNPIPYAYLEDASESFRNRIIHPYDSSVSRKADGLEFTGPVESYFPNGYGMYNVSGNAAEMVDSVGVSVGGSWDSEDYFLEIGYDWPPGYTPKHYYFFEKQSGPAPTLGFRVFMEILK
jgi:formylglycine-generating enzyme required for sulfatase activity